MAAIPGCERRAQQRGRLSWSEAQQQDALSTTDPEAQLYRKGPGKEAKLCLMGHALMENRNGLVVDSCLTEANRLPPSKAAASRLIAFDGEQ